MFNVNPMQMMQMMNNPQKAMQLMVAQNPLMKRAMEMTQGKSPEEIEQVCKNICAQKGIDFEQMKQAFQQNVGISIK